DADEGGRCGGELAGRTSGEAEKAEQHAMAAIPLTMSAIRPVMACSVSMAPEQGARGTWLQSPSQRPGGGRVRTREAENTTSVDMPCALQVSPRFVPLLRVRHWP